MEPRFDERVSKSGSFLPRQNIDMNVEKLKRRRVYSDSIRRQADRCGGSSQIIHVHSQT